MILNEIQKSIILGSSIRLKTDRGIIETYKGEILNAEKTDGSYGFNALIDIIKNSNSFEIEILNEIPITTITEGWDEIKNSIFNQKSLLFKDLKLNENEIFKLFEFLKLRNFSAIITNRDFIEILKEGNPFYSYGFFKENKSFNVHYIEINVLEIIEKSLNFQKQAISDLENIRKQFAINGDSGIILSYERFEVFENGIRILNLFDEFPIDTNEFLYSIKSDEEVKIQTTPFLTDKDIKVLSYILENSLKLLSEKVGKEAVNKAIEKHKPNVDEPQTIINCIKEVIEKAKIIGGTGWLKKNMDKISDGVNNISNEELRKLLSEIFKV